MPETHESTLAVDLSAAAIRERAMFMQTTSEAVAQAVARAQGPLKWCKTCGRKHRRRAACDMVKVAIEASTGRMVERWVHRSRTA